MFTNALGNAKLLFVHPETYRFQEISRLSLSQLSTDYPETWTRVRTELIPILKSRDIAEIQKVEQSAQMLVSSWTARIQKSGNNARVVTGALEPLVENRMKQLVLNEFYESSARKFLEGNEKLSFKNRWISNFLFFKNGLKRKPVSISSFRLLWPLVTQKGRLLSLVNEAGIYCFYSHKLIQGLSKLIGKRVALEIAAGDGTLTSFLQSNGVHIRATDDHSWSHCIQFPSSVEKLDAISSLKKYKPEVVLCSWPPPGNSFERIIFETPSVQSYYLITSAHQFAAGDWEAYNSQSKFKMDCDEGLSSLVLPPEADCRLFVFTRVPE